MSRWIVLLDYDGTLVPLAETPQLAAPDRAALEWLSSIARRATVHVVSGRAREVLDRWLGGLPIALHAEHGFWSRTTGQAWRPRFARDVSWIAGVAKRMETAASALPGAFVERKASGLAWHYRRAERSAATRARDSLRAALTPVLPGEIEILDGSCVLEVRDRRANKGSVARTIVAATPSAMFLAAGDDTTDEDMFAALPDSAITIRVGQGPTVARERVDDPLAARSRISSLLDREAPP